MSDVFHRAFSELNTAQLAILQVLRKQRLVACMLPRQVGKTHFGVWCIREVMRQNSNAQSAFFAKDYPSLIRATREKFIKLFPQEEFKVSVLNGISHYSPSQTHNRGACYLSGLDKAPDKLRGGTLAMLTVTEAAFAKLETGTSFDDLIQQILLPMISKTRGMMFIESTPNGSNFWKTFWDADNGFKKIRFNAEMCIQLGVLTREEVEFLRSNMHPDVFEQEMNCEFVCFTGKMYYEYREETHDICNTPIEPHERVIVGIDIGYSGSNCSALFGVWRNSRLVIFDQIYISGQRHDELAKLLEERRKFHGINLENFLCYSDVDEEFLEEMQKAGIRITYASKLDLFACRMSIKVAFYAQELFINPVTCSHLKKELNSASWSNKIPDTLEEAGDPNAGHWDSEASMRYLWRGARMEVEKPEEKPEHVKQDAGANLEWEMRRAHRMAAKAEKLPTVFEY